MNAILDGRFDFNRLACARYIRPEANATNVATAPSIKKTPCTNPQNDAAPAARPVQRSRLAQSPATVTKASTTGSKNTPTAIDFGDFATRYRSTAARVHARTRSDSKTVDTGNSPSTYPSLARYAVWTTHPTEVSATVAVHRIPGLMNPLARSLASASA